CSENAGTSADDASCSPRSNHAARAYGSLLSLRDFLNAVPPINSNSSSWFGLATQKKSKRRRNVSTLLVVGLSQPASVIAFTGSFRSQSEWVARFSSSFLR